MELFNFKSLKTGDLVKYSGPSDLGHEEKYGLVVTVNPVLGSGFQTADIIWCDNNERETVILTYLSLLSSLACKAE
tara:strand:- start:118 stop:345 length:228 start_codon:yes stop_codon:yes gene_type:complete